MRRMKYLYVPIIVIIQALRYDAVPIHTMHITNVRGYSWRKRFLRQSGMLMNTKSETGHENIPHAFSSTPPTGGHIKRPRTTAASQFYS
jgi:hypothetical protein